MTDGNGIDKDPPNLDILIKCMKMTTSDNDNQALVALRAANRQVAKFGGDWETILRGKIKIIGDPFSGITMPQSTPRGPAGSTTVPPRPRAPAASPPPRPQAQPQPQPTSQRPPPPKPFDGQMRPTSTSGNCAKCGSFTATERYSSLLGAWEYHHPSGGCKQRRDNERPNRFAGNCVLCKQRVEAHMGTTYHDGVKWRTEHPKGACPPPASRKRKQPLTGDDLMS